MAEAVDAAIIGGGVAGASVAYFLARLGMRNTLVLERTAVAAGASGLASGLASFMATGHAGIAAILKASADFYASWEEEIGGPPALTRVGRLFLAPEAERAALTREVGIMRAGGHQTRILERDELAALVPGWRLDDVGLAALSPDAGYIDPPMVTTALMNRARAMGVRVYQGAEVTDLARRGERVVGVRTTRGVVEAPVVVLAAGAWTGPLLRRWAGVEAAIWPERHQVVHLKPPAGMPWPFPLCADRHHSIYFRPEPGGLVLAANSGPDEPVPDPAVFDPTTNPWYERWILDRLARRIPAMRAAEIVGGHAGVYLSSADDFPILGPVAGVDGLYCVCDTAGNGMTSSPGLGRALAEVIVHGRTFTDIGPFRATRFAEGEPIAEAYRHAAEDEAAYVPTP